MNELSKLISSLLLLAVGFVAASLVGPPEFVGRLSQYLQPPSPSSPNGLRPLASNAAAPGIDGWPGLKRPATRAAVVSAPVAQAEQPTESPWSSVAQVSAMVPPASWSEAEEQPGGAPAVSPTPSSSDWLTGASFDPPATQRRYKPTSPASELTPIQRGTARADAPATMPTIEQAPVWPELRAPQPPVDLSEPQTNETATGLRRLPETSPYGDRPRYDATSAADTPWNPLRAEPDAPPHAPIDRQPLKATYTKHVVTDGDTLALLAKRYLGESSRAGELFELNRDRLEHPDVLPIGMVLLTPDLPARSQAGQAPSSAAFPALRADPSGFATVSTYESAVKPSDMHARGPLTPVDATAERPLTPAQRLGPVDPLYDHEVSWDANRW